ncbi:MAG: TetR/AcrR family transcriptional regulator [Salana multivorans]|uniref:TetR/AcrR family transcriptional regulator n=1 Tax=Salana multivorans TaxID=120377 RepID=UPI000960D332|nr:TetR/AcrR family transcriptional regulator [Salana multivorans]MBN8881460.1 TetR/AcrR family transcriptional regulator [Salana multivorans]OJX96905.1 MAG: hypothetical protein BGO96_02170 [Micrococcales bacterium 73-15]
MSTKDALVVSATRLIDEGGPEHVTLREVGRRSGVSHNAPYKHFADKTALLEAVALAELRRTATLFSRAGENPDAAAALRTAGLAWISWSVGHPERFRLVYGDWPEQAEAIGTQSDDTWASFAGLVTRAQEAGAVPAGDVDVTVDGIRAVMQGAVGLALGGHLAATEDPRAGAEHVYTRHLELLAAQAQAESAVTGDGERRSIFGRRR